MRNARSSRAYHIMMLPAMLLLLVFSIAPMSGIVIAFEKFVPAKGIFRSKWVGLNNFKYMFNQPDSWQVLSNTVIIAVCKIVLNLVVPVIVALLLNEIRSRRFKRTVQTIADVIADTKDMVREAYPALTEEVRREVYFITSQELEDRFPDLTPKEREGAIVKEQRTVFIMQIGDVLKSGERHDGRAPDYDDWTLNGDLLLWSDVLECPVELSSMGIRVNAESLKSQLKKAGCEERLQFPYHRAVASGELPLTIGGGIGQSRICLLLLEKLHIGEVLASVWSADDHVACAAAGIPLL